MKNIFFLRFFPAGVMDAVLDFMGINNAMDGFTGRRSMDGEKDGAVPLRKAE